MASILDGTGFVELLGVFGDDLTVVNAARVSFAKESVSLTEADKKLIKFLATNGHISPFFHPQIRLRLKMPIFVAREWFRHTVGFARNEVSRRYVDSEPEIFMPTALRERDPKLKQGSRSGAVAENEPLIGDIEEFQKDAVKLYNRLLAADVAPEVARGILPQNMYTEFIETASLYGYARLCQLRTDPHAQAEIRDYAEAVSKILAEHFPVSWKWLFVEHSVPPSSS